MHVILCVIDDPNQLDPVLRAWQALGLGGITIMESTGMYRMMKQAHIPMRYAYGATVPKETNYTLMTVVEDEETIQRCLEAAEKVVGDFNTPGTGIFISWPVGFTKGIRGKQRPGAEGGSKG